jgi:hypothetical protein
MKIHKNPRADILSDPVQKGPYPGVETADQPVLLDVPDSLDVVDGFVGVGLVTGTTGETGWGWIIGRSFLSKFTISHSMPTIGQSNRMSRPR